MTLHRQVNISPTERAGRIAVGLTGIIGGIALLLGGPSVVSAVLIGLLMVAGADLVATGAIGFCPLYHKLGHVPRSLRRSA